MSKSSNTSAALDTGAPASGVLITPEMVAESPRVRIFIRKADEALAEIGYTEHGLSLIHI